MERKITEYLQKWKKDLLRKPLLVYGSKQVGKTYSILEFGRSQYKNVVYFDTDNNLELKDLFKEKLIEKIILKLSALSSETIFKNDTLIVLDNVNDLEIVKGVKQFGSEKNDYHIIMMTSRRENLTRFKGEELQYKVMYGMDFEEYLWASDKRQLIDFIKESYYNNKAMPFHSLAMDYFYRYLMTGGLPEVVEMSLHTNDPYQFEMVKGKILDTYQKEMAYNKNLIDIPRAIEVFKSIPYQLQKENKKFQYGVMGYGRRAKEYETAIETLVANQMVYRSYKVQQIKNPLSSCREKDSFKLYLNDTGILFSMMHCHQKQIFTDSKVKKTLLENHVAKSLIENGYALHYYQSDGKAEIDFVIQDRIGQIVPVEIVDMDLSKSKALTMFMRKFTVKEAIRITEDNFSMKKGIRYVPVYATFCLKEL